MKTTREEIINCYGPYITWTTGKLVKDSGYNCFEIAKHLGFNCFAVAGDIAGNRITVEYDIYFFRGKRPEGKPSFNGVIQF